MKTQSVGLKQLQTQSKQFSVTTAAGENCCFQFLLLPSLLKTACSSSSLGLEPPRQLEADWFGNPLQFLRSFCNFEDDLISLLRKVIQIHEMLLLKCVHVCGNRGEEVVMSAEMPLVKEVTTTLREWGSIWKQLFVVISQGKSSGADMNICILCQSATSSISPSRPIKRRASSRSRD